MRTIKSEQAAPLDFDSWMKRQGPKGGTPAKPVFKHYNPGKKEDGYSDDEAREMRDEMQVFTGTRGPDHGWYKLYEDWYWSGPNGNVRPAPTQPQPQPKKTVLPQHPPGPHPSGRAINLPDPVPAATGAKWLQKQHLDGPFLEWPTQDPSWTIIIQHSVNWSGTREWAYGWYDTGANWILDANGQPFQYDPSVTRSQVRQWTLVQGLPTPTDADFAYVQL